MACLTLDRSSGVGVTQDKLGSFMTKTTFRRLPILLIMTLAALFPQSAMVLVVFPVTGNALAGCVLEHGTLVTLLAFGLRVLSS